MTDRPLQDDTGLDRQVRDFYGRQRLDPAQLRALREHATQARPVRRRARWAVAVALVLALGGTLWAVRASESRWAYRVAEEIALNHVKVLTPEVRATSYPALADAMPKLGFRPVAPTRVEGTGLRLVGGRYCSVGGDIAVQARLVDGDGRTATLYQFSPDDGGLDGDVVIEVDGVEVTLWREGDLLLGLARTTG